LDVQVLDRCSLTSEVWTLWYSYST